VETFILKAEIPNNSTENLGTDVETKFKSDDGTITSSENDSDTNKSDPPLTDVGDKDFEKACKRS
jgi:hypothetical protein